MAKTSLLAIFISFGYSLMNSLYVSNNAISITRIGTRYDAPLGSLILFIKFLYGRACDIASL